VIRRWYDYLESACKEASAIDSKYAKYSTEQLEVILTHLADPDEKELVKQELSKRYYNHYRNLIQEPLPTDHPSPEDLPRVDAEASASHGPETAQLPGLEEKTGQGDATPFLTEELADIAEVTPIHLTSPEPQPTPPEGAGKPASGKAAKKGWCFIATAAYGSPLAREVVLLQDFRDNCLSGHALGEKFIRAYYRLSPPLAAYISRHKILRGVTRLLLFPVIQVMKQSSRPRGRS
jgi:hypothetical protein